MKTKKLKTVILVCFGAGVLSACTGKKPKAEILSDGMFEMIYVEGGTFMMGTAATIEYFYNDGESGFDMPADALWNAKPAHSVTVSSFRIGKYEVTQKQWQDIMGDNPSKTKGDNLPVENVNYNDAQEFIRKLNQKTGNQYRLPTEAEWEYAARGGNKSKGYEYSGSNILGTVAWYGENSPNKSQPVGTKLPNELGIYDMSGNVEEWCRDWFIAYRDFQYVGIDISSPQTNPIQDRALGSQNDGHVLRGGNYRDYRDGNKMDFFYTVDASPLLAAFCHVSFRSYGWPDVASDGLGFRLVLPIGELTIAKKSNDNDWITGFWQYEHEEKNEDGIALGFLVLDMRASNGKVTGSHSSATYYLSKFEDSQGDVTIDGTVSNGVAKVKITSTYSGEDGYAEIRKINENEIEWEITQEPGGEYQIPNKAILKKVNKD